MPEHHRGPERWRARSRCAPALALCLAALPVLVIASPDPPDSGLAGPHAPAAARGPADPAALAALAVRYEHGEGVARSYDTAVRLYCQAAWQGHAGARYALGWMYANGRGVARDDALAAAWFRLAARAGDPYARRMLARVGAAGGEEERARCVRPDGAELRPAPVPVASPDRRAVERLVTDLAPRFDLDPRLVLAVIEVESAFDPRARSPKNAQGLMQLIPATASRFGVLDPFDPVQNLRGGMAYLRWLIRRFDGDLALALAGYNAGERAVERHAGIPPYPETRRYVRKVLSRLR